MNILLDSLFNNFIHKTYDAIHYILTSVSLDPQAVHLQMKYTNQDI